MEGEWEWVRADRDFVAYREELKLSGAASRRMCVRHGALLVSFDGDKV